MHAAFLTAALLCAPARAADLSAGQRLLADFAAASNALSALDDAPPAPPAQARPVPGKFVLVYEPGRKLQGKKWERILKESRIFEKAVAELNARFNLPHDLTIRVKECGEANAWYKADKSEIIYCYEEAANAARLLRQTAKPKKSADKLALGDAIHTLLHEVGHALVDVYDLPAVGREEDAVDQFATLELLKHGDAGESASQIAAMQFLLSADESKKNREHLSFWDEHSFDRQRYYDILCLIYGKDPDKHAELVPGQLPEERAERCPSEYEKLDAAWTALLAPHEKAASGSPVGK